MFQALAAFYTLIWVVLVWLFLKSTTPSNKQALAALAAILADSSIAGYLVLQIIPAPTHHSTWDV
jgi:hypothetical protein